MNIQQLKKSGWIIHECIVGSHLYGTNKEGSDIDIKGVFVLPTDMVLSGQYIEQISDDKQDTTYYEIGRFIELAAKANPNILDVLGSDKVTFTTNKWKEYFPDITPYLTTELRKTFLGYAHSQILKAKGMNKKTNWEKSRLVRKTPLDFCYVLLEKEESVKFLDWCKIDKHTFRCFPDDIGLACVNNFPDIYSMYYLGTQKGGIIGENSNDVQLRSIPKDAHFLGYMRFDRNAYSTHCKDFREYSIWLEKRNPLRYQDNAKADNQYDCHLDNCTEYLTEFGWKSYDDIKDDDVLITIDSKGNKILSPIIDRVKKKYTGDIYTYENAYTKFSVTPNHNLYLSSSSRKPSENYKVNLNTDNLKFITVDDFFKNNKLSYYTFFNSCLTNDTEFNVEDDYLKLMGLFLSDGSLEFNNKNIPISAKIYQSEGGKITKIINTISYSYKEYSYQRENKKKEYVYTFNRALAGRLNNDCGHGSQNKTLPFWVNSLSTRQLKLLVEYMFYGDGHNNAKGHRVYYTISKKLADSLQAACLCAGITVKIMGPYKQETKYGIINTMYHVYFPEKEFSLNWLNKKKSYGKIKSGWNIKQVNNEYISCFTTESGLLITRNTNKVSIQGNTKNMSHCVRLLYTAKDIALGKGLILTRPEREQLLDIRNGKYTYDQVISIAEELNEEVKELFVENKANLPNSVNRKYIQQLLLKIRKENI